MASVESENSTSYGAMERFLIWFLIPFVFTAVLLGVLLTIFDYDVMNSVLKTANKVPVVNSFIPDPKEKAEAPTSSTQAVVEGGDAASSAAQEISAADLAALLEAKDAELKKAEALIQERDQLIKDLQLKNSSLEEKSKSKTQSDDEYTSQIQQLATMYAKMTPSKSAPIMENLTTSELVLVLSMMKTDDRVKILEKMDPKKAAEASILLKDQTSVRDREIAALQERVNAAPAGAKTTQKLTNDDLGTTFATMTPKSAATVLLEMQKTNPDKVISVLSSMDSAGRSKIITALSEQSKDVAALISARLVQ
jgi:flagellar motility protein MotE (MotC chaperone)